MKTARGLPLAFAAPAPRLRGPHALPFGVGCQGPALGGGEHSLSVPGTKHDAAVGQEVAAGNKRSGDAKRALPRAHAESEEECRVRVKTLSKSACCMDESALLLLQFKGTAGISCGPRSNDRRRRRRKTPMEIDFFLANARYTQPYTKQF